MGGSTQVVPTTNNTQQKVEIPQYLQEAGQKAVSKASDYSDKPFQPFNGQTVAPLTQNQTTASTIANGSTNAGTAFLDQARRNLATGTGALGQAQSIAQSGANAGLPQANQGAALAHLAGASAANDNGAGYSLADLAGGRAAATSSGAGAADLVDARRYNAMSASPVGAGDISGYLNPYIKTALDPVIANLTRSSAATDAGIRSKAGMSGSFGGSRMGLQQSQNNSDLLRQIATTSGDMYSQGYDKALAAGQADRSRQGAAAGTSLSIANGANTDTNDAVQRLLTSATTRSGLANDNVNRLGTAASANTAAGRGVSDLTDAAVQRFLALIQPSAALSGENRALAAGESGLANDAINRLETTGQVEQNYNQDVNNAAYSQYQTEQQYALQQLNALIAAAGGTPYGTSTTSNTQGTQVVQKPSMFGQLAGLAMAGASMASNRDWKENFAPVDDEDVLAKFRGMPVEEYDYIPEVRASIGDDGRRRIGPMAQDFAKEFGGDGKTIPMPEVIGALVSAVRALDKRTTPARGNPDLGGALARLAA